MLTASLTTIVIVAALALSIRSERNGLIGEHRYNNLANDASAAREDHLG
jgi:hypothetical protein